MQSNLSDLDDNLSEVYKKECKACIERKNIIKEYVKQCIGMLKQIIDI